MTSPSSRCTDQRHRRTSPSSPTYKFHQDSRLDRIGGLWRGFPSTSMATDRPTTSDLASSATPTGSRTTGSTWSHRLNLGSGFGPYVDGINTAGPLQTWTDIARFDHQIRSVAATGARPRLPQRTPSGVAYSPIYTRDDGEWAEGPLSSTCPSFASRRIRTRRNLHFVDINGDGVHDAVYPCTGLKVQLGAAPGFSRPLDGPIRRRGRRLPQRPRTTTCACASLTSRVMAPKTSC